MRNTIFDTNPLNFQSDGQSCDLVYSWNDFGTRATSNQQHVHVSCQSNTVKVG